MNTSVSDPVLRTCVRCGRAHTRDEWHTGAPRYYAVRDVVVSERACPRCGAPAWIHAEYELACLSAVPDPQGELALPTPPRRPYDSVAPEGRLERVAFDLMMEGETDIPLAWCIGEQEPLAAMWAVSTSPVAMVSIAQAVDRDRAWLGVAEVCARFGVDGPRCEVQLRDARAHGGYKEVTPCNVISERFLDGGRLEGRFDRSTAAQFAFFCDVVRAALGPPPTLAWLIEYYQRLAAGRAA